MKSLSGLVIGAFALTALTTITPTFADGRGHKLTEQVEMKVENKAHAGAIAKRRVAMRAIGDNMKTIGGYLKGKQGSPADVAKSGMAIANIAKVVPELFPVGTGLTRFPTVTGAKPEIFADSAGFKKALMMMASAAENLASVAATPNVGKKEIGMAFGGVGKSCGSCHKVYRKKLKK